MKLKQSIMTHSLLAGGIEKNSSYQFDLRNFFLSANTEDVKAALDIIWEKIKPLNPEIIFGTGIGAFPLLTSLKLHAYNKDKIDLKILFLRDKRKTYATKKLIEGEHPNNVIGKRAVFVDDLINQSKTYQKTIRSLIEEDYELNIVGAVSLVDYWRPNGSRSYNAQGFPMLTVFRRHDFGLTRDERNLPKLLKNEPIWKTHAFHNGRNVMVYKSAPIIHENYLLIGNDNGSHYCYDKNNGNLLWKYDSIKPGIKGDSSVSQIDENMVYWTTYDGAVRCCNVHTGKLQWISKLDNWLHSSPHLDKINKRIFIGTERSITEGDIVCLNYKGHEIWRFATNGMVPCTPTYSEKHNIVCCGSNDFHVYILNADNGELIKSIPIMGESKGKPAFSENQNIVVVASTQGWVYGLETITGTVIWKSSVGSATTHCYPCVYENFVVVSNDNGLCFCFNINNGNTEWIRQFRSALGWGVIDVGYCLLSVTTNGYVNLLNKHTGEKLSHDVISEIGLENCQPPAFDGENLIIVTNNKGILTYKINIEETLNEKTRS
jgi:outer membrane protein assembly factor BamB/orotate phosphoribosyltransferase